MYPSMDDVRADRATLRIALRALLARYVGLVNCGDCGNWDPEQEPVVIQAREALNPPLQTGSGNG
jgi:hypothetical protein